MQKLSSRIPEARERSGAKRPNGSAIVPLGGEERPTGAINVAPLGEWDQGGAMVGPLIKVKKVIWQKQ